jgi:hypothetical protein
LSLLTHYDYVRSFLPHAALTLQAETCKEKIGNVDPSAGTGSEYAYFYEIFDEFSWAIFWRTDVFALAPWVLPTSLQQILQLAMF